jgi:tRNA G18 (ribose-2'-O)-methylase SpoU
VNSADVDASAEGDGDADDPLELFRALNHPERRREIERRGDFFLVEGLLGLRSLVETDYVIRSVLVADRRATTVLELVGRRAPIIVRPADEVRAITGFNFHRGVIAAVDRRPLPPVSDVVAAPARRLALVEGVNDHENLGALFRNAAGFGIDGVLLDPTAADPLYRRSVRVSMGHVLRVPWTRFGSWPGELADLRAAGFTIVALTPAPHAQTIDDLAAHPPDKVAFMVGAEGPGLTDAALAAADRQVRIPLSPQVDSLNVATAAALAFHRLIPRD